MNKGSIKIVPSKQHPGWQVNITLPGKYTSSRVSEEVKLETAFRNLEFRNNYETLQRSQTEKRIEKERIIYKSDRLYIFRRRISSIPCSNRIFNYL